MKITAVVVTYNRKQLLIECLNAIYNQSLNVDNVILIDNNSTDGTYDEVEKYEFLKKENFIYKKLDKNIGGSGGFYNGIKIAHELNSDWIWIMDDDTIPTKNCLEELVRSLSVIKSDIGYLASSIYGENGEYMNVPVVNQDPSNNGYPDWYNYLQNGIVKIKNATFVSLLINDKAVEKIGYPVKDYFIWGDDTEYTYRLNKFYGECYMIGKSVAIHKRKIAKVLSIYEEDNKTRIKMYYYMYRNTLINMANYEGKKRCMKTIMYNILITLKLMFKPKVKYKFLKIKTILKGTFDYILKKYDYRAFKNRLNINVQYKEQ